MKLYLVIALFISLAGQASVSFKEKQLRVEKLMTLGSYFSLFSADVYLRELDYEKRGLSTLERAKLEKNLLADKIRAQILMAYQAAEEKFKNAEMNIQEVKRAIYYDLDLAENDIKSELINYSILVLNSIDSGAMSKEVDLPRTENFLKNEAIKRQNFLNQKKSADKNDQHPLVPLNVPGKTQYNSKQELVQALVTLTESSPWMETGHQVINTAKISTSELNISLQLKVSFLGASLEAGPMINFKREYSTNATIVAEGFDPVVLKDGSFDYWQRDSKGKPVVKNGKMQKRYMYFSCDANLKFQSEYSGSGRFTMLGAGGAVSTSTKLEDSLSLSSLRLVLPEYIGQNSITKNDISQLCHHDFLKARFPNGYTVQDSLDLMMRNIVASSHFVHHKTKCAKDEHCFEWFNERVISLLKNKNFPRCREEDSREKFFSCQLRGLEGQKCPVIEKGRRTSDGQWEYECDVGLTCLKYQDLTYVTGTSIPWTYAKGKCQKMNSRTYRNPLVEHRL